MPRELLLRNIDRKFQHFWMCSPMVQPSLRCGEEFRDAWRDIIDWYTLAQEFLHPIAIATPIFRSANPKIDPERFHVIQIELY